VPVEGVAAYLPYVSEGWLEGLELDVDGFSRLTVIVGRNASGKTALLEALGYLASLNGPMGLIAQGLAAVSTVRPRGVLPQLLAGAVRARGSESYAGIMAEPANPLELDKRLSLIRRSGVGKLLPPSVYDLVLRDSSHVFRLLYRDVAGIDKYIVDDEEALPLELLLRPRRLKPERLLDIVRGVVGRDYALSTFTRSIVPRRDILSRPFIYVKGIHLAYIVYGWEVTVRAIIFTMLEGVVVAVSRRGPARAPGVVVSHPGFVYRPFMFETLYYESIRRRGLPREREAARLLRRFIPWFEGFELVGSELHVRSRRGRRISVYRLSDGQRAAVLLGLLYAAFPRGSLVLLDTPEAFVHPDGLDTVANLVSMIVADGGQVLVATQSAEMLESILRSAREHGILGDTVVKHIQLSRGKVTVKGSWIGETALGIVEELSIDLRRVWGSRTATRRETGGMTRKRVLIVVPGIVDRAF